MKNVQQEISNLVSHYHACMVKKDTETLTQLLDDNYYLVHLTGYVQPKQEWFQVMRSGTFDYHDISIRSLKIDATDEASDAIVTGDGIFKATIYGMNRPWHLYFKLFMKKQHGHWLISHAEYSS